MIQPMSSAEAWAVTQDVAAQQQQGRINQATILVGVIVVLGLGALLMRWIGRRLHRNEVETWSTFAIPRGMRVTEVPGQHGVTVEGTVDAVGVVIVTAASGPKAPVRTHVTARVPELRGTVRVYRAHALSTLGDALGLQDVKTGDAEFDREFVVKSEPEAAARPFLKPNVQTLLLAFAGKDPILTLTDGEVSLQWLGKEANYSVLDAACELVATSSKQ